MSCKSKKTETTGQPYYVANNMINREFTAQKRLEKLFTDITYLPFGVKTLYLSSILDLFNGEIIAYTISDTQNVNLVRYTSAITIFTARLSFTQRPGICLYLS